MYFATHFNNWYHVAPLAEVARYVEELALWGCNALSVWFDMHHYAGLADPAAQRMVERLRLILQAANRVGMGASLTMLANEAYASSPPSLRADWTAGHDGYFAPPGDHYHVELCPGKPGGLDLILQWRDEMLAAFGDIDLEYAWLWPYDQGGCTCADCAPWGANGFLKTSAAVAQLVRARFPRARIVLSTWYFDHFVRDEWRRLAETFQHRRPDWIDYLLIDDFGGFPKYPLRHGVPGDFPVLGFPEISMEGMSPWGAFGANPRPRHWASYHCQTRELLSGSFPYSEGVFEDLNKVLHLQWGWDPDRSMEAIVREYAAGHFTPDVAEGVLAAALMLEEDLGLHAERDAAGVRYRTGGLPRATACFALLEDIERRLPEAIRSSWRWRLLRLRAALDAELKRTGGRPSARSDGLLREVAALNHTADAHDFLRPPYGATTVEPGLSGRP